MKNKNVEKFFTALEAQDELLKKWGELFKIEEEILSVLSERRKALGLSQKALGEKVSLKQSAIARIENGAHSLQLDTLIKLVDALDMKLDVKPREDVL